MVSKTLVPLIEGKALEGSGGEDGGVIDEDVEAAEGGDDLGDSGADGGFGANVARDGERAAAKGSDGGGGLGGVGLGGAVGDGNVGAGASEGESDGAAEAACASGDEDRFAGERLSGHHKISLTRERS